MSVLTKKLQRELQAVSAIRELTDVFQNTASIKIRAVRAEVLASKLFFNELWGIYQDLRVRHHSNNELGKINRHLHLYISSPAGLAGPSDEQILRILQSEHSPGASDIIVLGSHGNYLLKNYDLAPLRAFEMPDIGEDFMVEPILEIVRQYETTTAYYNSYQSLTLQRPAKLTLLLEAQQLTEEERLQVEQGATEIITADNYILEPNAQHVIDYLSQIMLNTSITQLVLESQLAQQAGRFTNMSLAHSRAEKLTQKTNQRLFSLRRRERDESTRQIVTAAGML